jgi:hypothetical protein
MWYFLSKFCKTCSGTFLSLEKGPPGAKRIKKKLSVTITNMVGIRLKSRRMMYFDIIPSEKGIDLPGTREGACTARWTAADRGGCPNGLKKTEGAGAPSVQEGSITLL